MLTQVTANETGSASDKNIFGHIYPTYLLAHPIRC